jgi:hypothetical protein
VQLLKAKLYEFAPDTGDKFPVPFGILGSP